MKEKTEWRIFLRAVLLVSGLTAMMILWVCCLTYGVNRLERLEKTWISSGPSN